MDKEIERHLREFQDESIQKNVENIKEDENIKEIENKNEIDEIQKDEQKCIEYKDKGNEEYKKGDTNMAIEYYE